jgi:hypothetical protein
MNVDLEAKTIAKLLAACADYRVKLDRLEEWNAVLQEQDREREKLLGSAAERETRMLARIGQLQKDKERVDYVEKRLGLSRSALDVAMEVANP